MYVKLVVDTDMATTTSLGRWHSKIPLIFDDSKKLRKKGCIFKYVVRNWFVCQLFVVSPYCQLSISFTKYAW